MPAPYAEGPGDFAIGLAAIEAADWLEGGEADPAARKDPLLAAHPALVWGEVAGSRAGQAEVLAMVRAAGVAAPDDGRPPLLTAARAVADDLCLMEKRQGEWRLTAVSLSAGSFFTAEDAIGKSLGELHAPVPGFAARFQKRVERIFDGLRPGLVLQRRNWSVLNTDALHTPDPAPYRARIGEIRPDEAAEKVFVRMERQTLRRLPDTGGVLFTIRIWRHPLAALDADPARRRAFAVAWRGATDDYRAYKKLALFDTLVESFLRARGE
ncbi:heme-dependent oxidative N-demethylase family protein [Caulobacter sp. KR2-114]|uniref:heme-dependent oxidative N-demethylase family protein n=1 Tax=Caulobacter sp. KR2-114 TaxID=3400912 RepID=UPI003C0A7419